MKEQQRSTNRKEANDFVAQLVEEVYSRMSEGEKPSLAFLVEKLLNEFMLRERDRYLQLLPEEKANGFYSRNLHLTLGKLNLRVPRIRYGKSFRPAILPPRWKRADKDYEELLIGMLANGYSHAQLKRTLKTLGLPFSEDALADAKSLIHEQLEFYKSQPLPGDLFAVFIDAYSGKLRDGDGKIHKISLFVAVGIDLDGNNLGSTSKCNCQGCLRGEEYFVRGLEPKCLPRPMIKPAHRILDFLLDNVRQLPSLRKVLANQPVRVLV